MLSVPVLLMVFVGMYYLWSVTFAAQNAHMRAREYAFHRDTYLGDRAHGTSGVEGSVWSGSDYKKAERGITPFRFGGRASDNSIPGMNTYGSRSISTTAYITSYE